MATISSPTPGIKQEPMQPIAGIQPLTQPPLPGAQPIPGVTPISPEQNLLSSQINPGQATATAPAPIQAGPAFNPTDSDRFANYSSKLDGSVNELTTGPNRTQLAMTALQDFDTAGQPQLEQGYRRVGQRAAALGRLGAGMTTNDLTGLSATYQRDRGLMARGLARDVAEGDINDRFRRVGALSGLRGQEEGIQSSRRGEQRQDRGYQTDVDRDNRDATSRFEDRRFNQEGSLRDELRGERGYQTERSDKALDDSVRQRMLEESLLNSSFGRASDRLSIGSSNNPYDAYERAAGQTSDEAGELMGAGSDLIGAGRQKPVRAPGMDYQALLDAILKRQG